MKFIRTLIAILAFIEAAFGYLTQNCLATSSSFWGAGWEASKACDNNAGTAFAGGTAPEIKPWL